MTPGKKYLVRFRTSDQRVDREMVAVYLGWSRISNSHQFSLRPHAGTVTIKPDFMTAEPVESTDAVHVPRKARTTAA